jgi:Leucine-rich repeat (LRR) protein
MLEELIIAHNNWKNKLAEKVYEIFPNNFSLPMLKTFSITNNYLCKLPPDLNLPMLENLNLTNNQISFIENNSFANLKQLTRLDLSNKTEETEKKIIGLQDKISNLLSADEMTDIPDDIRQNLRESLDKLNIKNKQSKILEDKSKQLESDVIRLTGISTQLESEITKNKGSDNVKL